MSYDLGAAKGSIEIGYDGKGVEQAKSALGSLKSGASNLASSVVGSFGVAAGAVAAFGSAITGIAIAGGIARQLKIEDAQAKLRGLGNDAQSVEAIMNSALESVEGTAYGLDTAATVAATAVAAGIKPGQELTNYLKLTADAATIAGTSMEEMGSIINKTTTSGIVFTDNLNQLADRGIPIFTWLQDEYGVTASELRDMVSRGEVDSETFRRVIEQNIGGAALESGNTTRGAYKNMMAALSRTGQALTRGVFPYFKDFFNNIRTGLNALNKTIGPVFDKIGASVGKSLVAISEVIANAMASIDISAIADAFNRIGPFIAPIAGLLVGMLGPLLSQIPLIGRLFAGLTGPIGLAIGVVFALMSAFPQLRTAVVNAFSEIVVGVRAFVAAFIAGDGDITSSGFAGFLERLGGISRTVFNELVGSIQAFVAAFRAGDGDITSSGLPGFFERLGGMVRTAFDAVRSFEMPQIDLGRLFAGGGLAAVAATIAGVMGKLGPLTGIITRLLPGFSGLSGVISKITPLFKFLTGPVGILVGLFTYLYATNENVRNSINNLLGVVFSLVGQLGQALIPVIVQLAQTLLPVFVSVLTMLTPIIAQLITALAPLIAQLLTGLAPILTSLISSVLPPLISVFQMLIGVIMQILPPVLQVVSVLIAILVPAIQALLPVVLTVFQTIADVIGAAMKIIEGIIKVATSLIAGDWSGVWDGIKMVFSGVWDAIVAIVSGVINFISGLFSAWWDLLKTGTSAAWDAIKNYISDKITAAKDTVSSVIDGIKTVMSNTWAAVETGVSNAWDGIKNAVSKAIDGVVSTVETIKTKITDFFSGAGSWLTSAGSDIIQGLINGIRSMASRAADAARSVVDGAINGAKKLLGIASPSKVFRVIGEQTGEGLEIGLQRSIVGVAAAARDMADSVTDNGRPGTLTPNINPVGSRTAAFAQQQAAYGSTASTTTQDITQHITLQIPDWVFGGDGARLIEWLKSLDLLAHYEGATP